MIRHSSARRFRLTRSGAWHRYPPFSGFVNFWMGGYEADEGDDDDPGRVTGFVPGLVSWYSDKAVFSADLTAERIATLDNGLPSPAASDLARHYLINCTNRVNLTTRFPLGSRPWAALASLWKAFRASRPGNRLILCKSMAPVPRDSPT